ncbi:hypothetical protein [Fredinandcohnia sp. 179-A 10B2 NHS]|uniref:hypothetical protein n=1 Tax=Fredinandcohnia sp. 179-A 10B2 NHS TaxID=3235176 RepID=UPI00399FC8D9
MDAPVFKKLTDIENQQGNPYNTAEGQQTVSIAEPFWVRMSREGIMAFMYTMGETINNTYVTRDKRLTASKGRRLYLARISFSTTVAARVTIQVRNINYARQETPLNTMPTSYFDSFYVKPYENVERVYNGELWLEEGMSLDFKYQSLVTDESGLIDVSAMGWEVVVNA